jgi:hypothetical protein
MIRIGDLPGNRMEAKNRILNRTSQMQTLVPDGNNPKKSTAQGEQIISPG